jgi:hypothetical protein
VLAEYESTISQRLGASAVLTPTIALPGGKAVVWQGVLHDPELTYMELWGAIRVAGRAFQMMRLTDAAIAAMQNFLLDQFSEAGEELAPDKSAIEIETIEQGYTEVPIAEFLVIKHVREIYP